MIRQVQLTLLTMLAVGGAAGCSPPIMLPPAQEPLDSIAWKNCAADAKARSGRSLIDDMKMDGDRLLCEGVVLSNDPAHEDDAVEMLTEAALLDKQDYRPYWLSAQVLTRAGRYEEALTHFARAQKRSPGIEIPTIRLAELVSKQSGDGEALNFLEKADRRGMCTFGCRSMLADLYHRTGKADKAMALYEKQAAENPEDPEAYVGMARLANADSEFRQEARYLKKATATKGFKKLSLEQQSSLYYSRAFALYNSEQYEDARKMIQKATRKDAPADWMLLSGWIELKLKDPAMASIQFEKAIKIDDKLAAAHSGAGDAAKALNNLSAAKKSYERAAFLDPTNGEIKLKLAAVYIEQNNFDKAKIQFNDAVNLGKEKLPAKLYREVADALEKK